MQSLMFLQSIKTCIPKDDQVGFELDPSCVGAKAMLQAARDGKGEAN